MLCFRESFCPQHLLRHGLQAHHCCTTCSDLCTKLIVKRASCEPTSFSFPTYMERTRKIQASFNPPHLPRATQPPLPPSSTFSSRHSAETYTATYGGTRSRHACRRRVGAKVRDLLVRAPASSTKTEFSKQLGLAKPLPEVQLLSEVNVSQKLLSETQRKAHENRIPGSKSAWDVKQYLVLSRGEPSGLYLLSKLLCCAVRVACTARPASFIMASNSLRLLFAKFSSISLVQQV